MVAEAFADNVLLYLQVLVDEVGTVLQIRHNTAHMCSGQYHGVRPLFVEEPFYGYTIQQVKFFMTPSYQVCISSLQEIVPNS